MPKLKIKNILPTTRIALFRGSGNRDYTDDDIIFHNFCVHSLSFDLKPGDYAIRTIHKETFLEHIDVELGTEDKIIEIDNSVDPTAKTVIDVDLCNYFIEEYLEESNNLVEDGEEITEDIRNNLNDIYNSIRQKYEIPLETEFKTSI